ncbi:unnamed protein product, partial [marine sediment metagenome]
MKFLKSYSWICFDGEEDAAKAAAEAEAKAAAEVAKKKDDETKTFSQDEVNAFLAKEKRKTQDTQKQLATQLQEYKRTAQLGGEERIELEKQIEDLQKQYMTVEERSRQASEKATKKHQKDVEDLGKEKDSWKNRYTRSTINSAIAQAAVANKAIVVEQIAAMLHPSAKLAEKLDEEGKPTGVYEPRVDFQDLDKDEKPVVLDLTIPEAVKRMTELPQYGNLFEGG